MEKQVKSENVLKVIRNLESVLPRASRDSQLDMDEYIVYGGPDHPCGTVHCHGGWYAIATCEIKESKQFVSYTAGAHQMAKDLEVGIYTNDVEDWAKNNPEIWGNNNGKFILSCKTAFISPERPKGANNLKDIVDHWKDVYNRLVELENKAKREDVTSKLAKLPADEKLDIITKKRKKHETPKV